MVNWIYYKESIELDDKFHAALVARFGKDLAGTRRYQPATWGKYPDIIDAHNAVREMNKKMFGD